MHGMQPGGTESQAFILFPLHLVRACVLPEALRTKRSCRGPELTCTECRLHAWPFTGLLSSLAQEVKEKNSLRSKSVQGRVEGLVPRSSS